MVDGKQLKDAVVSASNNISNSRQMVNELNIFPVPDGDTGTNMSMTIFAAVQELKNVSDPSIGICADKIAAAQLRGARGNSGVILSLLFRGFASGLKDKQTADGKDLAYALSLGVRAAYKAVMKPTEGTMLTVARIAAEEGMQAASHNKSAVAVWEVICSAAHRALKTTPDLLPVLKKAGVVDAGGMGLTMIFDGMLSVFRDGEILPEQADGKTADQPNLEQGKRTAVAEWEGEITFTYCTEFIIGKTPDCTEDPLLLRAYLDSVGDSLVFVEDESIIKVHVHTDVPGAAMQEGLKYGELLTVKIDNMREQKRQADAAARPAIPVPEWAEPTEEAGFVAVAVGEGVKTLFTDLGVNQVVNGGQTMNPSTEDILCAISATPAKTVYVLPNNKNIIMAAEQAVPLADRKVIVVPTRTVPQGLSALLAYDCEQSEQENQIAMITAADHVSTGHITFAARDSEYDGNKIGKGEIIALENGKLILSDKTPGKAFARLLRSMVKRDTGFITIIYGEDVSGEDAAEVLRMAESRYSHAEVTLVNGGQPVYYYIVSVE